MIGATGLRDHVRRTIESAGARYVGIRRDSVSFRDPKSDEVLSLYVFAVTPDNVRLSLKSARERQRAAMWEFA